jgi:formate hydrogenlyase subunit 4
MVHEAMVLEYSGRYLAMIELAASMKLLLYVSVIACIFFPFGFAWGHVAGLGVWLLKLGAGGILLGVFESSIAKMRVFRVPEFLGIALMLGLLGVLLRFVSRGL